MIVKIVYFTIQLLEGMGLGSFFPIYTPWLELHGLNFFKMGYVNFIYHIASSVLDPFTGAVADKMGKRATFIVGQFLWTCTQYIYGASTSMGGFLAAECVAAVGGSLKSDALESWLQNRLGNEDSKKVMSQSRVLFTVGQICTSILAGYVSVEYGMKTAWLVSGSCFLAATVLGLIALSVAGTDVVGNIYREESLWLTLKYAFKNKTFMLAALSMATYSFVSKPVFMYWPQVVTEHGMPAKLIGFTILAMALPSLLGDLLAGQNIIFTSTRRGLVSMYMLTGVGLITMGLAQNLATVLIGLIMVEIAYGTSRITKYGLVYDVATDGNRSTINSLISAAKTLGGAASLLVMGVSADLVGPQTTMVFGSIMMLAVAAYLLKRGE